MGVDIVFMNFGGICVNFIYVLSGVMDLDGNVIYCEVVMV